MLKNVLHTAKRTLRRDTTISLLNIAGLATGMAAAILIFLWVNNEMTYDGYNPGANRIYRITSNLGKANWIWATSPLALASASRTGIPDIRAIASIKPDPSVNLRVRNNLFAEERSAYIDTAWFSLFHYDFLEGSPATLFQHPFNLALTRSKAKKYFGATDPIGQTILQNSNIYRVAAVVEDIPANSSFQFDILMPLEGYFADPQHQYETRWSAYHFLTFVRLRPDASPTKVAAEMTAIFHKNAPGDDTHAYLTALKDMHFETNLAYTGGIDHIDRRIVYVFSILGICLITIACVNYVNLTTAKASIRAREVSIRKIIGAGKKQLFTQFLAESLVVSSIALLIAAALVQLAIPFFSDLTDRHFTAPFSTPAVWEIMGITLVAATLLNGIYPALLLSRFRPLNVLKGVLLPNFKDAWLRKGLVVLQFTFAIVLIVGVVIIRKQLSYIQHSNPGYDRSQVFYFQLPYTVLKSNGQSHALLNSVKQRLLSQTSVLDAAIASESPIQIQSAFSGTADWDGRDTSGVLTIYYLSADADFFKVLRLQMEQGRWFDPRLSTDRKNFILNETAVKDFNLHLPALGQRFSFNGDTGRIVGIIKDFHFASLHDRIMPLVIYNHEDWRASFFVRTQPGKTTEALAAASAIWQQVVPDKAFDFTFLDDQFNSLYKTDQKLSTLILAFCLIAILISCLGLFGLAAFTAQQRTKEIGIRKVLGATVTSIVTLLSVDFIRLVVIAILIASPIAWWAMDKWLQDFAYHIPVTGWIFLTAGSIALFIAVFTISTQAIRAAMANPAANLRTD
jgi:predicted permease